MRRAPQAKGGTEATRSHVPEVEGLLTQRSVEAADALVVLADGADRSVAKEARRALYLLRQAGIEPATQAPQPAPEPQRGVVANTAMASTLSGAGGQMVGFLRPDPWGGKPQLIQALINYDDGLLDIFDRKVSRDDLEEIRATVTKAPGAALVDLPVDYARHLVYRAAELTRKGGAIPPEGFQRGAQRIGPLEAEYPRPLVYGMLDADEVRADLSIPHDAARLFENDEFASWLPELQAIQPWVHRFTDAGETRIWLAGTQKAQLEEKVIDDAADDLVGDGWPATIRRRLEEQALVLHLAGRRELARAALYQAVSIPPDGSVMPHNIPFLREYIGRVIVGVARVAEERTAKQQREEPPGLIQRP